MFWVKNLATGVTQSMTTTGCAEKMHWKIQFCGRLGRAFMGRSTVVLMTIDDSGVSNDGISGCAVYSQSALDS